MLKSIAFGISKRAGTGSREKTNDRDPMHQWAIDGSVVRFDDLKRV